MATLTNMTTDEFAGLSQVPPPGIRALRPYTDLVFQPMLELLVYLRANQFKTYIVSGGTVEFMRVFAERVYGIPPEQVVGTTFVTKFQMGADGNPVLMREPKIDFIDDGPGKPVGIQKFIGRRPILAFGNSDGDQQMLQWTAAGSGARFMGGPSHRLRTGVAYDRQSHIGKLDKASMRTKVRLGSGGHERKLEGDLSRRSIRWPAGTGKVVEGPGVMKSVPSGVGSAVGRDQYVDTDHFQGGRDALA